MDDYDAMHNQLVGAIKANDSERAAEAGVWLLTTALRDLHRIADALEQISMNTQNRS